MVGLRILVGGMLALVAVEASAAPRAHGAQAEFVDAAEQVVSALKVGDMDTVVDRVGEQGLAVGSGSSYLDADEHLSREARLSFRGYIAKVVYCRDFLAVRPRVYPPGVEMSNVKERARGVWTVSYLHGPKTDRWRELDLHFKYRDGKWWLVQIQNRQWEI